MRAKTVRQENETSGTDASARPARSLGGITLLQLAVASMVGTGVFTSSGYLLESVPSASAVLLAWLIGAFVSWCGALAYGELCAALPANGGEYALLGRIYHPSVGFAAGVVSIFAGFGGALGAIALGAGEYAVRAANIEPHYAPYIGLGALAVAALLHTRTVRTSAAGQNAVTALKVLLCVVLAVVLMAAGDFERLSVSRIPLGEALRRPAYATGLVYVAYAYSGWNAASYVAGEATSPQIVPRALGAAAALVGALYLALNVAFLVSAPMDQLAGQTEIAHAASEAAFGERAARGVSGIIAAGLLSTLGAMLMTGARVLEAMAHRFKRRSEHASPSRAVLAIAGLTAPLILLSDVRSLLLYAGSALSMSALMTAAGVFVLRRREPELVRPYRTWGHPFTTLAYVAFATWMLIFVVLDEPVPSLLALLTAALPAVLHAWWRKHARREAGSTTPST